MMLLVIASQQIEPSCNAKQNEQKRDTVPWIVLDKPEIVAP